jgi:uncharacterized protein (TIGR02594 family)
MAAIEAIRDTIEAAQADRETAQAAGRTEVFRAIFSHIVQPLNAQEQRMLLDPRPDAAEYALALRVLEDGISAVGTAHAPRCSARAATLRALLGQAPALPKPSVNPDIPPQPPVPALDQPEPPPLGEPGRFIAARRTLPKTVIYVDSEGREMLREGGSRSWRTNNPGNIRKGSFTDNAGAIGDDGAFAIFPDEQTGFAAIVALLRTPSYTLLNLRAAIFRYAPPSENESDRYLAFVIEHSGVGQDQVLRDIGAAALKRVASAIRSMEGWTLGSERANGPASVTTLNGGVSGAAAAAHEWMAVAEREAALPERERSALPDPDENPRILEYFRVAAAWFEPSKGDETDWCAAFVNWCLIQSGHVGTDHPGARSFFWNRKGQFLRLPGPAKGAIGVIRRNPPVEDDGWQTGEGHVGFVASFTPTHVTLLGGNQSHTVRRQTYPMEERDSQGRVTARFVAFVMPVMN